MAEAIDGPVVAGAGSNNTQAAVELTERATAAGAAGLSRDAYYNRPSQAGLLDHFKACAAMTDVPVLLCDIKVAPAARSRWRRCSNSSRLSTTSSG